MIPDELRNRDQWICWRAEQRGEKLTKIPRSPHGGPGDSTDPATWGSFFQATEVRDQHGYDGIGYVFSADDPYCGIDLDGVRDSETGGLEPWAEKIVAALDSFTEVSPSGTGIHVYMKGSLPAGGRRRGQIEMYSRGRFFTVSGEHLRGSPLTIEERGPQLALLHRKVFGEREHSENGHRESDSGNGLSDQETISKAMRSRRGEDFSRLWSGAFNGHGSHSEADLALCSMLAFWTGGDEARIDALFRQSGLMRPKWDRMDYRERTISAAVTGTRTFYEPKTGSKDPGEQADPSRSSPVAGRILIGRDIRDGIQPPDELIAGVMLAGRVTSLYAGAGKGKTWVALWIILQAVEQGRPVILFDMENGRHIISERLMQLGADPKALDRLLYYYPQPSMDPARYEVLLDEVGPALVVFDSWINFLAGDGLDENAANDIASWAACYTHPARSRGASVLLLDHIPKEGASSRGSSRKKDEVDTQWSLYTPQPFDRHKVGRLVLNLEKDREGWLPQTVGFSVGGGEDGFLFRRSDGTVEADAERSNLRPTEERSLTVLLDLFADSGAGAVQWQESAQEEAHVARNSFFNAKKILQNKGFVIEQGGLFYPTEKAKSKRSNTGPMDQTGPALDPDAGLSGNDLWKDRQQDLEDALAETEGRPSM